MSEKIAPAYSAVKLALPAPRRRGRTNGLNAELEKIKADPGEWYRVGVYASKSGASSVTSAIRNTKRSIPAGDYEFQTRVTDGTEGTHVDGSALWAMFVG